MSSPEPSFFSFNSIIEKSKMKVRRYFVWPKGERKQNHDYFGMTITVTRVTKVKWWEGE